jgi:UrcA family protein
MFALAAMIVASAITPIAPAPSGAPRAIVRTDDLDLGSAAGAAALRRRVDQAVLAISADETVTGRPIPSANLTRARATARKEADRMIDTARRNEAAFRLKASGFDNG